ncbi:MAG: tyrosine-type recombinase/integrase [Armatimonadota bacterium]|nr:tyrosine-type recombinase/integrase [Armatimonadota bacterium]
MGAPQPPETAWATRSPGRSHNRKALPPSHIEATVKRLTEYCGIDKRVTPHVLRHTAATRMLKAVGDVRRVQEFLGHADVSTTQVYAEVLAEDVAEGVDVVADVEPVQGKVSDAEQIGAELLAALPPEARDAPPRLLGSDQQQTPGLPDAETE